MSLFRSHTSKIQFWEESPRLLRRSKEVPWEFEWCMTRAFWSEIIWQILVQSIVFIWEISQKPIYSMKSFLWLGMMSITSTVNRKQNITIHNIGTDIIHNQYAYGAFVAVLQRVTRRNTKNYIAHPKVVIKRTIQNLTTQNVFLMMYYEARCSEKELEIFRKFMGGFLKNP